ncbi:MAG: 7-carboxy-7-deazaguanine synthase QueE [Thermoleophilia bacterium]
MRVVEIFDSLQGEGFWAGTPMTFVRFAGCNAPTLGLDCVAWCDTDYSWDAEDARDMSPQEVIIALPGSGLRRVCLTGGEPLLQGEEFADLVTLLQGSGRVVHVETNGTLDIPGGALPDWVTVSPKPPRYAISSGLREALSEIKVVVGAAFQVNVVEELSRAHPGAVVCLQPEWSSLTRSAAAAVSAVMAHPDWRLSIQLHKVLGIS